MNLDLDTLLSLLVTVVTAAATAYGVTKKGMGTAPVLGLIQAVLDQRSALSHAVCILSQDPARGSELRSILMKRGYRDVTIAEPTSPSPKDAAIVLDARGLDDLEAAAARAGVGCGVIYWPNKERRDPPPGDWTFANSPLSLFANTTDVVAWVRGGR